MIDSLKAAFVAASPRETPRPMHFPGLLIYFTVAVTWVLLVSRSFSIDNIWVWSAGIAYILYDTFLMIVVVWQTLPIRNVTASLVSDIGTMARPSLGVIIAAHNESKNLPTVLAALSAQSDEPDEILIADDGSVDAIDEFLNEEYGLSSPKVGHISERSSRLAPLRWMRLKHLGKAHALNIAIGHVQTDVLVTLDADTFLANDAIFEMRKAFATNPALVAACGVLVPICKRDLTGYVMQWFQTYEYVRNIISRFAWMKTNSLLLISGAFAGFRRNSLVSVGGFDSDCLVEDYELSHRLHRYAFDHRLNWQLSVIGSAVGNTNAPSDVATFLRQRRRWFAGFLQTQYWNRDLTGNTRYGALGKYMLPIKAIDTMQPIYGLTAFTLFLVLLAIGENSISTPVFGIITAKIVADFAVYLWTVHLYRKLTGGRVKVSIAAAAAAALLEPFSFQLLRHAGAAWGWVAFLRGSNSWGLARRVGAVDS